MLHTPGTSGILAYATLAGGGHLEAEVEAEIDRPRRGEPCSTWRGFGGRALLRFMRRGHLDAAWWGEVEKRSQWWSYDLFNGVAGLAPLLAIIAASDRRSHAITRRVFERTARTLSWLLDRHEAGQSVPLGLAHGVAGLLLAVEQCGTLLNRDVARLRERTAGVLLESALESPDGHRWPTRSRQTTLGPIHGLCDGAPGIAFTAIFGLRYSGDTRYQPLLELAVPSLLDARGVPDWCCGALGRAEVLIEASRLTQDAEFLTLAAKLVDVVKPASFALLNWGWGQAGLAFTRLRLIDETLRLPGYPHDLSPLPWGHSK